MFGSSSYLPHIWNRTLSSVVVHFRRICLGRIQRSHWKSAGYGYRWPHWRPFGWDRLLHPQNRVTHIMPGPMTRFDNLVTGCKHIVINHLHSSPPPPTLSLIRTQLSFMLVSWLYYYQRGGIVRVARAGFRQSSGIGNLERESKRQ